MLCSRSGFINLSVFAGRHVDHIHERQPFNHSFAPIIATSFDFEQKLFQILFMLTKLLGKNSLRMKLLAAMYL